MVKNSIIAESFLILLFLFTNMFFKAAQRLHWVSKTTIIKCILLRLVRGTYANSAVLALYCRFGLSIGTLNRVIRVSTSQIFFWDWGWDWYLNLNLGRKELGIQPSCVRSPCIQSFSHEDISMHGLHGSNLKVTHCLIVKLLGCCNNRGDAFHMIVHCTVLTVK